MPLELVRVERVDPCPTVNPSVTSFLITAVTIEETPRTVQFQTVNKWHASLCKEAKRIGKFVWVGSKQSRYGYDIVTAKLDDSKFEHKEAS